MFCLTEVNGSKKYDADILYDSGIKAKYCTLSMSDKKFEELLDKVEKVFEGAERGTIKLERKVDNGIVLIDLTKVSSVAFY